MWNTGFGKTLSVTVIYTFGALNVDSKLISKTTSWQSFFLLDTVVLYLDTTKWGNKQAPVFVDPNKFGNKYCWWKTSQTTTWDVRNHLNNGIFTISTGAAFLPSTVVITMLTDINSTCYFGCPQIFFPFLQTTNSKRNDPRQVVLFTVHIPKSINFTCCEPVRGWETNREDWFQQKGLVDD